jgi:glutamine phosphoribosylpyrophosphate amidotransferase
MCGIAGMLHLQRPAEGESWSVGQELLTMAACLQHRGSDSAGFVVFGSASQLPRIEVMVPSSSPLPEPKAIYDLGSHVLSNLSPMTTGFSANLTAEELCACVLGELASSIESLIPGAAVTSAGRMMTVRKTVGEASNLSQEVTTLRGTHGIAHLRLATESKIDPAHAQPFWARGFLDIAVTHNGHITNYYKMRKRFESRGFSFGSANDSEIIGIYLGEKMSEGMNFHDSLCTAADKLDGSFSFIVANERGLGVTRDAFATKPLLYCETESVVALASEPQALHRLLGDNITIKEIQPKETRTWERA